MSVHIAVVDTTQEGNEIKLLNRKIKIESKVPKSETKNEV